MQSRSKVVELSGHKFEIRKLPPDVGSFILLRMLGMSLRSAASAGEAPARQATETEPPPKISGEVRVRALTLSVLSGDGLSFEVFKFIQSSCMKVVSIFKVTGGAEVFVPIMSYEGVWTPDGAPVAEDVGLTTKLAIEVLILCFADFFEESSPITG